jgi:hypothetical protein
MREVLGWSLLFALAGGVIIALAILGGKLL